eukprot:2595624-Pyramimonas_sp.AAC.1
MHGHATRLALTTVIPAALHGDGVHSFSPSQASWLRAHVSKSMGMSMNGFHSDLAWALSGVEDPLHAASM